MAHDHHEVERIAEHDSDATEATVGDQQIGSVTDDEHIDTLKVQVPPHDAAADLGRWPRKELERHGNA